MLLRVVAQGHARRAQQRSPQRVRAERTAHRHRRQAIHPCATQQSQQDGLGLIARMVRRQQHCTGWQLLAQRGIARLARSGLRPLWMLQLHPHAQHLQRHGPFTALCMAVRRPAIGTGLETVMHMDGAEIGQACHAGQMQQHGGIHAAAIGQAIGSAAGGSLQQLGSQAHSRFLTGCDSAARSSAALRLVDAFGGGRIAQQLARRPHRARCESTAAIGAATLQTFSAAHTKRAFKRADARISGIRWQVHIAALAIGPQRQHGGV